MTKRSDGTLTGRRVFAVRVAVETPAALAQLALEHGLYFIGAGGAREGAAGQLMDKLAAGELVLTTPPKEDQ